MQIPARKGLGSKWVLYTLVGLKEIIYVVPCIFFIANWLNFCNVVGEAWTILIWFYVSYQWPNCFTKVATRDLPCINKVTPVISKVIDCLWFRLNLMVWNKPRWWNRPILARKNVEFRQNKKTVLRLSKVTVQFNTYSWLVRWYWLVQVVCY
jgi:hypothetical protein